MNYILFNADGSIKKTNFTEVINQNSNEENQIFVSVDDLDIATHSLVGVFVLPNGEISTEAGVATSDVEYIEGVEANGYLLTLTQSETFIPGLVFLTLQIKETSTNKVLYTYRVALTINESAALASVTQITLAQYNAIKDYIDSNFVSDVDLDNYATKSEAKLYKHTITIASPSDNHEVSIVVYLKSSQVIETVEDLISAGIYVDIDEPLATPLTANITGDNGIAIYTQIEPNSQYISGYELIGYYVVEGYQSPFQSITFEIYNIYDAIEEVGE